MSVPPTREEIIEALADPIILELVVNAEPRQ